MKYVITKDGLQQLLGDIDSRLSQIEVKGESVSHLFIARAMFKELIESFKEEKEDIPKTEGDKNAL